MAPELVSQRRSVASPMAYALFVFPSRLSRVPDDTDEKEGSETDAEVKAARPAVEMLLEKLASANVLDPLTCKLLKVAAPLDTEPELNAPLICSPPTTEPPARGRYVVCRKPSVTSVPAASDDKVAADVTLLVTATLCKDARAELLSVDTDVAPAESEPEMTADDAETVPKADCPETVKLAALAAFVTCNVCRVARPVVWTVPNDPSPVVDIEDAESAPVFVAASVVTPRTLAVPLTCKVLREDAFETTKLASVDPSATWRVPWRLVALETVRLESVVAAALSPASCEAPDTASVARFVALATERE